MSWLDKLTNPLTERVKSPLYGTFIISWILCNWKIVLTLLMPKYMVPEGYTLLEFIYNSHFINVFSCAIFPLILSALYIYFVPLIDLEIIKYTEEQRRIKIDTKIEIGKKHKVDGAIFYALKLKFQEEQKKSIDFEEENTKLITENKDIEKKLNDETALRKNVEQQRQTSLDNYDRLNSKYQTLYDRSDLKGRFEGRWKLTYFDVRKPSDGGEELIEIRNEDYIVIEPKEEKHKFRLKLIDFDVERRQFSFVKAQVDQTLNNHCYCVLQIKTNDRFEGNENENIKVLYVKQKFNPESDIKKTLAEQIEE